MKKILAFLLALAMIFCLAACGSSTETATETAAEPEVVEEEAGFQQTQSTGEFNGREEVEADLNYTAYDLSGLKIGYVTIFSGAPWGGLVGTSFEKYAEECGAEVEALDANQTPDTVTEYCYSFIDEGVDALVVFGGDITAMCDVAAECKASDIPLFLCALDVAEQGRDDVTAVIGPDQYTMCQDIAAYVVDQLGTEEEHTVVQINGVPFLEDYIERTAGFQTYMADYPNYDMSTQPADAYSSRPDAKSRMESFMAADDSIDVCMGYDDDLTMGAVQAIEEAGKTGQIHVFSLTGQNDAIQAVADGKMDLTVMNRASDIGMGTVSAIGQYFRDGKTAYYHRTPLTYITPENAADYIGKGEF